MQIERSMRRAADVRACLSLISKKRHRPADKSFASTINQARKRDDCLVFSSAALIADCGALASRAEAVRVSNGE